MERPAVPAVAAIDAVRRSAGSLRRLRRGLEPVALARAALARWTEIAAYGASALAFLWFASFALERHRSYESTAYDLGFFDQIIWNTSHGRWFETTFTDYNFLGQHFQPVLLPFALAYRLGAGVELLLVTQCVFVAVAAVPLYYAVRRATSSGGAGLSMSVAFLLGPALHRALDFDFHPELMGFFFVFLATYYLVARRPLATIAALVPLLALKEDMPLVLAAFALLLIARGFRREGAALFALAATYAVAVVLVLMPWIRGGSGDLTERYGYLVADSTVWSIAPDIIGRALRQLWTEPLAAVVRIAAATGFAGAFAPLAALLAMPSFLLATLSDHPQQSRLEVHYAMAPLALTWVGAVLGIQRFGGITAARVAAAFVLGCAIAAFLLSSPYVPLKQRRAPSDAHQVVIRDALAQIPAGDAVSAQGTLLPHLSRRRAVYEFPDVREAPYVIIDSALPITAQSRAAGYDREIASLAGRGYDTIFDRDGVRVFRRSR